MQEHQVTAAGVRHASRNLLRARHQNPIEMEGTYPLPEAQLDRFMFNVVMDYLEENDEVAVVTRTTSAAPAVIEPLFTGEDVLRFHEIVRQVPIAEEIVRTRCAWPRPRARIRKKRRISSTNGPVGAPARAPANTWSLGAKVRALLKGRAHVTVETSKLSLSPHSAIASSSTTAPKPKHDRRSRHQRLLETLKPPWRRLKAVTIQLNHEWTRNRTSPRKAFQKVPISHQMVVASDR